MTPESFLPTPTESLPTAKTKTKDEDADEGRFSEEPQEAT
jgi:hypothetical protein